MPGASFEGFREIKDLPTGDQRVSHSVGITETIQSIQENKIIVWVECGTEEVDHTKFKNGTPPAEIQNWIDA